jgi:uncharacterized protein YycO
MIKQLCLISILLWTCLACESGKNTNINKPLKEVSISDPSQFQLKPGDLLFQDSDCGPFCEAIEKVTSGVGGAKFSHVGMVVTDSQGELVVIEAVTAGVVTTPLDSFFSRSFDAEQKYKVVVGRLKDAQQHLIPKAIEFSKTLLGKPYDKVFDINNDAYYCSELVYEAFKYANNGEPIFQLQKMTYLDPDTGGIFPIWDSYFQELGVSVPEGEPGLNPGGMSLSDHLTIVHFYGNPEGYQANTP